jgi:hypothetical protein
MSEGIGLPNWIFKQRWRPGLCTTETPLDVNDHDYNRHAPRYAHECDLPHGHLCRHKCAICSRDFSDVRESDEGEWLLLSAVKRFVLAVNAFRPAILMVIIIFLGIYLLYTPPVATVQTQSKTIFDLAPPAARRIGMLVISIFIFALLMFWMTKLEWNWQTRPISELVNENVGVLCGKSMALWFLINILASGLNIMLRPYASADAVDLGLIVASCVVLYDVLSVSEMLQDIVKHMLYALLFLVTIVNLFVTTPILTPLGEMAIVAVGASGIDFITSYAVRKRDVIGSIMTRVLGLE